MNALFISAGLVVLIFVMFVILYRTIVGTKIKDEEYLEVITTIWQSGRYLRHKMEIKKDVMIPGPYFYRSMAILEDQKLIESRIRESRYGTKRRQYRKTIKGQQYKKERPAPSKETSIPDEFIPAN